MRWRVIRRPSVSYCSVMWTSAAAGMFLICFIGIRGKFSAVLGVLHRKGRTR
jgi:hypothetical protein